MPFQAEGTPIEFAPPVMPMPQGPRGFSVALPVPLHLAFAPVEFAPPAISTHQMTRVLFGLAGSPSLLQASCPPAKLALPALSVPQVPRVSFGLAGSPSPLQAVCTPAKVVLPTLMSPQDTGLLFKRPEVPLKIHSGRLSPRLFSVKVSPSSKKDTFSVSGLKITSPLRGIDRDFSKTTAALIVFNGLLDNSLDPKLPQWRPELAYLVANPKKNVNPDTVFHLLLFGCEGIDDFARMTVAENWARRFESGEFYAEIAYAVAKNLFNSGKYPESALKCSAVEQSCPALAVRALILRALSETYSGDMPKAHQTLSQIKENHPQSPEMPEVHYMEAWLALQEMNVDEAKSILQSIVHNSPNSPVASKAVKTLESLESPL